MSKLISGKEALIALANGEEVQIKCVKDDEWYDSTQWTVGELLRWQGEFRLKPCTITINGVEVPAPFEPKDGDEVWCISDDHGYGYCMYDWQINHSVVIGVWRTEEEIKQVVSALRSVFKPQ